MSAPWYPSRLALATLILATPAAAGACGGIEGSSDYCTPVVACIEDTGVHFTGRAVGWGSGTLAGQLSSGAICSGTWVSRNRLGLGQADLDCDDGQSGTVIFTYQDGATGTATGRGLTKGGQAVRGWSGRNIRAFLRAETGEVDPRLMCGEVEIPLS
ncbi:MAG: hypothetical protein ACK4KW_00230 [Gemmobacter sp.]